MEFLGLSLFQFLAAAGGVSAFVVALYFLDRRRRRVVVSSFRFWRDARVERHPLPQRKIQQPWSLLLQILALLCLLAALADIRWTANAFRSLDHVLILDTSSWMLARDEQGQLMERARRAATQYVRSLPAGDRILVVTSDANPKPAAAFEEDIRLVESVIAAARPGSTALNLGEALQFARQMLARRENAGDIVFVGSRWIAGGETPAVAEELANLRVIPIDASLRNVFLERVSLQPSLKEPGLWTAFVTVGNRGGLMDVPVQISFGGAPVAGRTVQSPANASVTLPLGFRAAASGWVDLRLDVNDSIRADNSARVELPRSSGVRVQICTRSRAAFEALFRASPGWNASYSDASPCPVTEEADLVVLDRVEPAGRLTKPALWIQPPLTPAWQTREVATAGERVSWNPASPISEGLGAKDLSLPSARVFGESLIDEAAASVSAGPIAVARRGDVPQVAWGFHPLESDMRYEVTTPLLFANTFRWLEAQSALPEEITIGSAGTVLLSELDSAQGGELKVTDADGRTIPVAQAEEGWRFFAGTPGMYRVRQGHRESIVSLTLPEAPGMLWEPKPEQLMKSIPTGAGPEAIPVWWPWLAAAGLLFLFIDAYWFDRRGQEGQGAESWNPVTLILEKLRGTGGGKRKLAGKEAQQER